MNSNSNIFINEDSIITAYDHTNRAIIVNYIDPQQNLYLASEPI